MKQFIHTCLNSVLTPIVCLAAVLIENKFTYAIPGAWPCRALELALCTFGLIAAVKNYSSWLRVAAVFLLSVGVLSAAVDLPRDIREAREGVYTGDFSETSSSTSDSPGNSDNSQYRNTGNENTGNADNTRINIKPDCPTCGGIGGCPSFCLWGELDCPNCVTGDCIKCGGDGVKESYDFHGGIKETQCKYCKGGKCKTCGGTGRIKCTVCNGTGRCPTCGK